MRCPSARRSPRTGRPADSGTRPMSALPRPQSRPAVGRQRRHLRWCAPHLGLGDPSSKSSRHSAARARGRRADRQDAVRRRSGRRRRGLRGRAAGRRRSGSAWAPAARCRYEGEGAARPRRTTRRSRRSPSGWRWGRPPQPASPVCRSVPATLQPAAAACHAHPRDTASACARPARSSRGRTWIAPLSVNVRRRSSRTPAFLEVAVKRRAPSEDVVATDRRSVTRPAPPVSVVRWPRSAARNSAMESRGHPRSSGKPRAAYSSPAALLLDR